MNKDNLPIGFLDIFNISNLPSTHPYAHIEQNGKAIYYTTTQGFLCYGQYQRGYPTIPLQAVFSIQIDDNIVDDRNILILDVYDHHIDRVVGKRVITRKDFEKSNEFCLFTFDFTPQSSQANMEFRIYYMGYAYVHADKIAIIDPSKITLTSAFQIPQMEIPVSPQPIIIPETIETDIPYPWEVEFVGEEDNSSKSKYRGESFIVTARGGSFGRYDDEFKFVYQRIKGDGVIIARVVSIDNINRESTAGLMIRESFDTSSAFVMSEVRTGSGTGFRARKGKNERARDQEEDSSLLPPYWLKLECYNNGVIGFISPDGQTWTSIGRKQLPLEDKSYWGLIVASEVKNVSCTAVFDNVQIIQY